jgi:hypothetical protein
MSTHSDASRTQLVVAYNHFLLAFLKEIKAAHPDVRALVKREYRTLNASDASHLEWFASANADALAVFVSALGEAGATDWTDRRISSVMILRGADVATLRELLDERLHAHVGNLLFTSVLFARLYNEPGALGSDVARVVEAVEKRTYGSSDDDEWCVVLDDDIEALLTRIVQTSSSMKTTEEHDERQESEPTPAAAPSLDDALPKSLFDGLENSTLGKLAQSIANEVDVDKLASEAQKNGGGGIPSNPAELLSSGFFAQMVTQVSSTIHQKIQSGELDQQQLMSEAMSMMGSLGGLAGAAGGSGAGAGGLGAIAELMQAMQASSTGGAQQQRRPAAPAARQAGGRRVADRLRRKRDARAAAAAAAAAQDVAQTADKTASTH